MPECRSIKENKRCALHPCQSETTQLEKLFQNSELNAETGPDLSIPSAAIGLVQDSGNGTDKVENFLGVAIDLINIVSKPIIRCAGVQAKSVWVSD